MKTTENFMKNIACAISTATVANLNEWFDDNDNIDEETLYTMWVEQGRVGVVRGTPAHRRIQEYEDNNGFIHPDQVIYEAVRQYIEENIGSYLQPRKA